MFDVLESLAVRAMLLSEGALAPSAIAVMLAGAVLAGFTWRSEMRLRRVRYLVGYALVAVAVGVSVLLWSSAPDAVVGGWTWGLFAVQFVVCAAAGYAYWVLAVGRSFDIEGDRSRAVFAFVPLVNIWLFVAPGMARVGPWSRTVLARWVVDPLVVVAALAAVVSARGWGEAIAADSTLKARWTAPEVLQAMAARLGREDFIVLSVRGVELPQKVDEVTQLVDVRADGARLVYVYEAAYTRLDVEGLKHRILGGVCDVGFLSAVLSIGGVIVYEYRQADSGRELARLEFTGADCAASG